MKLERRTNWMLAGFLSAGMGDWLLAVKGCSLRSAGFLAGIAAFAVAQLLWMSAHMHEARPNAKAFVAAAVPLSVFVAVRLWPILTVAECVAISAYALVSSLAVAMAYATRRWFYLLGALLLAVSDTMIGMRFLRVPGAGVLVGPLYIASELAMLWSCVRGRKEGRFDPVRGGTAMTAAVTCALAGSLFVLAARCFPGGDYNPFLRMLSALGRTEIRLVEYPWCHALFTLGMFVSVVGIVLLALRLGLFAWGVALNVAGLAVIAFVPENVQPHCHNFGCWLAAIGGGMMLVDWIRTDNAERRIKTVWALALLIPCAAMGITVALHAAKVIRFSPSVPTAQKFLILAYMGWVFFLSVRRSGPRARVRACVTCTVPILLGVVLFAQTGRGADMRARLLDEVPDEPEKVAVARPLSDDERAGLAWLEYVTGPLTPAEEKDLWDIGGTQHGIFAKRYSIAFAGYAAAAVGMRGNAELRARAGRVVGNCLGRMIRLDVWAYSQSKSYWGRKPWAPDPCYRENVMYTGHLLHLLALYEQLTGDRRYHRVGGGWDFVWKDGRRVHYDVEKLIDVTVEQMRKGPNGGVTCEPGLMFFACNNHPHVALKIFRQLGYRDGKGGDWTADAARWENWALDHLLEPALGGGVFNLVYHVYTGLTYPRGQGAFDGWSLQWYAAWATDPRLPKALWRRAVRKIDWAFLERGDDLCPKDGCADPQAVAPSVTAVFLAAAARACGDAETAARLEKLVDARYLRRENGRLHLELDRNWRIGASAVRILSLAWTP